MGHIYFYTSCYGDVLPCEACQRESFLYFLPSCLERQFMLFGVGERENYCIDYKNGLEKSQRLRCGVDSRGHFSRAAHRIQRVVFRPEGFSGYFPVDQPLAGNISVSCGGICFVMGCFYVGKLQKVRPREMARKEADCSDCFR